MTGGGTDILAGSCDTPTPDCPVIVNASMAAEALLSQMATDGVAHVVYAFYPDPVDVDLRAKMDALRPLDRVAYVRWASVYRNFQDAAEFEEFVRELEARQQREIQARNQVELPLNPEP